jgi:chromosome segregation protein
MISRLIEAKPEELRIFIEEAAGISKYKERRKETEARMKRTRENLDRLQDLRDELERQLQHLERQAQAAEKYRQYRQEERERKAQLLALRWQAVDHLVVAREENIRQLEIDLEAGISSQHSIDANLERRREQHVEINDQVNSIQATYYQLGADLSRIEQSIQHQRDRDARLNRDLEEVDEGIKTATEQLQKDQMELRSASERLSGLEPEWELLQAREDDAAQQSADAEEELLKWQQQWEDFNQSSSAAQRQAEVEQQRLHHLEQSVDRLQDRLQRLQTESQTLDAGSLEEEVAGLEVRLEELEAQLENQQVQASLLQDGIRTRQTENQQISQQMDGVKNELQKHNGILASLEALQQAALQENPANTWLNKQGLDKQPRLAQTLKVVPGWELSVETVLGNDLQAIELTDLMSFAPSLDSLVRGQVSFVWAQRSPDGISSDKATRLLDLVSGNASAASFLTGIYAVENLETALNLIPDLHQGESVISRDGVWVGPGWLKVCRGQDEKHGFLQRQQQIQSLHESISTQTRELEELNEQWHSCREMLQDLEQNKEQLQRDIGQLNRTHGDIRAQLSARKARLEQFAMRKERIVKESEECRIQQQQEQSQIRAARAELELAVEQMNLNQERREQLQDVREHVRQRVDEARSRYRQFKEACHAAALEIKVLRTRQESGRQVLSRLETQLQQWQQRRQQLEQERSINQSPVDVFEAELEEKLQSRMEVEDALASARAQLSESEHQMRAMEKQRAQLEQTSAQVRTRLEQNRMEWQAHQVQRGNLAAQILEEGEPVEQVLETLPEAANEADWQVEVEKLAGRITRLGAINLAAIDEFKAQNERKQYLDAQNADLCDALETLESAIRKIDRETRTRFKETFEKVNKGLQDLFPKVFGGGHAYLELTGEDLLDTGVAIMARPPGKKNSTIHLLSGGEKALTAIALVFSIFQLTPAPFCMLDEVDAPLDDANVGRYSRLVEQMSSQVQFIYITHNKIAMEMAQQLMGVTMHEPGVSRLVSVNVEEAAAMAAM